MLKDAGKKFNTTVYALAYCVSRLVFGGIGQCFVIYYFKFAYFIKYKDNFLPVRIIF